MKISELIEQLKLVKAHSGDLEVRCLTLTHAFPPELLVKKGSDGKTNYLVLNA